MEKSIQQNHSTGLRKIYNHVKTFFDSIFNLEEVQRETIGEDETQRIPTSNILYEESDEIVYIRDYEILWPICVLMV